MNIKKLIIRAVKMVCLIFALVVLIPNILVEIKTTTRTYDSVEAIPYNKVGVVLGTTKYVSSNVLNPYYTNRINAAWELYKAEKVDYLLVSGDNAEIYYNEPITMRNDLVEMGVDKDDIYLDYAGFRTLDSVVRSKEIFGQESITVISQAFHNKRAIFIADNKGVAAVGYNAKDVNFRTGFKTNVRELFARVKMVVDLVVDIQPRFLGERVEID